ncbi:MAG TPA: tetratricopeptide repeat protein [Bryobacteraceae bacterium]|nr:tetratricopeptide repeat protein [Bryobacteraceae bacterium]
MAVLRFENLTGDPSLDWMGRALSEMLASGAAGSKETWVIPLGTLRGGEAVLGPRPVSAPGISAERTEALLAGADRLVYGEYSLVHGRLRVAASVEDPGSGRMLRTADTAGRSPDDLPGAATALALRLGLLAGPFATPNPAAWRHYSEGLEERDPAASLRHFKLATEADHSFGQAWRAAIATAARTDPAAARELLERARAARASMTSTERARLDLELAGYRGDRAGQKAAFTALAAADPADPGPYRGLAALAQSEHDYAAAAALLRKASTLHPDDPALLNTLGYAEAWAGNLPGAAAALRRYGQVRPDDPNALDSLGDVHLYLGKPAEAGRFYQDAYAKDPSFQDGGSLLKAAFASLIAGDPGRAGTIFERYIEGRRAAADPFIEYRRAEWLWLTGERRPALQKLSVFAAATEKTAAHELAARAHAHMAVWSLELGDAAGARGHAEKAQALSGPASGGIAAVARFLTLPPASASEWRVRAERTFFSPQAAGMKQFAVAYALLFGREFQGATPLLKEAYARWTPMGDPAVPVLLAWAYAETGRAREAAPLVEHTPVPQGAGLNLFTSLWFPRLFAVRAQVLEAQGRKDEAARQRRQFLELAR